MNSIWTRTEALPDFPVLPKEAKTDVLIIGGGISGILCAYMLEQAGVEYILVEAGTICSGITKNTTAKITFQHGLIYHKLIQEFGTERAKMYFDANAEAFNQYRRICGQMDCDYEIKDSYVYALKQTEKLERELEAVRKIGYGEYSVEMVSDLPLPIPTAGAVKFAGQAQFHPLKFIREISAGLNIYEHTKVIELERHMAKTDHGNIHANRIVVATHFPILNKHGFYFLKMYQSRSYVLALKQKEAETLSEHSLKVDGMYVEEAEDGMSFRNAGNYLLLSGGGHRTGKEGGDWMELEKFAGRYYPEAKIYERWATQDCMTLDRVPYIGQYGKYTEGLYVMTGYNKWGMTSSMAAAMLIRDIILGIDNPYQEIFAPDRTVLRPQLFVNSLEATKNMLTLSAKRCPHLGCALKWNRLEHTWDCPCHGSRFTKEGQLIDNPATDDLKQTSGKEEED